jgi:hypothetical protein
MAFENLWAYVDANWGDIMQVLRVVLPLENHEMYDDEGRVIASGRPMIESLICERMSRNRRFFWYTAAAGLLTVPEADVKVTLQANGCRVIEIGGLSTLPMDSERHAARHNLERKLATKQA